MIGVVVVVAMLIGLNFSMLKFGLDHTTPLLMAAMRTVVGGTAILGFALARGEALPRRRSDLMNIFVVSLSITTLSSGLLLVGVSRVPAGLGSLIASTMPLFTAGLSFLLLRTAVSSTGAVGLATGFGGVVVLASPSMGGSSTASGVVILLFAALAWAFGNVYMKFKDFSAINPMILVGVQLLMSSAVLLPVALVVEGVADTDWSTGLLWPLLYASIPANAVTFALLAWVASRGTPTQAAASAYLIPVFGVTFGALLRGERLGWLEVGGGLLVVIGVYLVVTSAARIGMAESAQAVG